MLVYHRTHHAQAIVTEGFRDGYKVIPRLGELRGVFVSADWPLDENEGADGDAVLELAVSEALFVKCEHVEDDAMYRESMIPAASLNEFLAGARQLTDDEEDELTRQRWETQRRRLNLG